MSYIPRVETTEYTSFITARLRNSELWFINNPELQGAIMGYLARYQERYKMKLYGFGLQGNHYHMAADFPGANRAGLMRDFNSTTARSLAWHCPDFSGGRPFEKRYSLEYMPTGEDVLDRFFYIVLQAVNDGLVDHHHQYPSYNCFEDAINGEERVFTVVNWSAYNAARRKAAPNKVIDIKRYTSEHTLTYDRIPGYEHWSKEKYVSFMRAELKRRRLIIIERRRNEGKISTMGAEELLKQEPGTRPHKTKKSTPFSYRTRILCACPEQRKKSEKWHSDLQDQYKHASEQYRAGNLSVEFPLGMYKPPLAVAF